MLVVRACEEGDVEALERDLPTGAARIHAAHWRASRSGGSTYLIAWADDVARGVAVVNWEGPVGSEAAQAFPGVPEITHLQVTASARGQGVGTWLIRTAEAMAETAGLGSIAIGVSVDNMAARRLYERLGYRPTGVIEVSHYVYIDTGGRSQPMSETNTLLVKPLAGDRHPPTQGPPGVARPG